MIVNMIHLLRKALGKPICWPNDEPYRAQRAVPGMLYCPECVERSKGNPA